MATHGTPMSSTPSLYRPGNVASAATASPATPMHAYATQPPKPFAAGAVQSGAERSRLLELLRAPNNLTSPTLEPSSKGLLNGPGQNNCFLNCAVQVSLLSLQIFSKKSNENFNYLWILYSVIIINLVLLLWCQSHTRITHLMNNLVLLIKKLLARKITGLISHNLICLSWSVWVCVWVDDGLK